MSDLSTTYLGLPLRSPIVASAGPLTGEVDTARRLAGAGAAALVMPSLFEEEILAEEVSLTRAMESGAEHFAEALGYFPHLDFPTARDRYVSRVEELKAAVDVPVIASLNATHVGSWVGYARMLADAGADAVELNLYRVAAAAGRRAAEVEEDDLALIDAVRAAVSVPLAVKLSPFYTSMANFACRVVEAGADGLVLFNRFYQPDLDLEELAVLPKVTLSQQWELRLPLRWLAILRPLVVGRASLAATSGIQNGEDVVKAVLVGADVTMMTSQLLRHGPEHLTRVETELAAWLEAHDYVSVNQARGSVSYATSDNPAAFERANYLATIHSWTAPDEFTPSAPSA
jgi:dihydroorotate dehydrogenase (fumarate)